MTDIAGEPDTRLTPTHPLPTRRALIDLGVTVAFVWVSVALIHYFDVPTAIARWANDNEAWAIDEVTLVSLCVVAGLGVFSWRRWRESLEVIARHEATLERLRSTESAVESKDRLIKSVSHELRTPLTALLGYAELLRDPSTVDVDRFEAVTTIVDQGQDLANIVDDLLTKAQAEAETLTLASVTLSMGAQVAQVVEGWGVATSTNFRVSADRGVKAVGDPSRVRQIVRNLVSNAIRYGDGTIEIATRTNDDSSHVLVANPGSPIPEEQRERIFEPYHRVNPDVSQPAGLGLGLSISRQLARMMGGDITYHHRDGMSVFDLSLPRATD
jgi:signal transduction histidine kinase